MLKAPKVKFEKLWRESYLAMIKNSVGTKMFRTFYVVKNGKPFDVTNRGELSCAIFASTVLYQFKLTPRQRFTVASAVKDLTKAGAKKVTLKQVQPGDVLIWEPLEKTDPHNHIGFYLGNRKAISNSKNKGMIVEHDYLYNGKRKIELVLRPNWKRIYAKG